MGADTLIDVESLQFSDGVFALSANPTASGPSSTAPTISDDSLTNGPTSDSSTSNGQTSSGTATDDSPSSSSSSSSSSSDGLSFAGLFTANLSQSKAIAAAYQTFLGGVPSKAGFDFLIKGNLATNLVRDQARPSTTRTSTSMS